MNSFRGRLITWIFVSLLAAMLVMRLGWGKGKHRRFQDQARPVASLDLMAPPTQGWLNDHAVFFLREKNQGDFQCVSVDIHTLKETVIESLSPLLRDLEDRSQIVEIRASPSGQFLAVITGNADSPNRYRHDLISGQSELMMGSLNQHAWNQGVLSWMPHERGWIEWDWIDEPDQPSLSLKGRPFSKPGSTTEPSPLLRWPEGSHPWILHAPVMTEQGRFLLAHAFGDPSMPASNTFTLRLESIAPDPSFQTLKPTLELVRQGTLSKWIKVAHSGNGQRWMVLFERTRFLPKWHFLPKFPFVRRDWKSQRLGMGDRQDPATIREIEVSSSMYPAQWHLNTTGTWMSFVHQGHLWVAPWEQPWNGSL